MQFLAPHTHTKKTNLMCLQKLQATNPLFHTETIQLSTYSPILIPSQPTLNHVDPWDRILLHPSQQQLKNSLNQKTKPFHNQNMGWEKTSVTHPPQRTKNIQNLMLFNGGFWQQLEKSALANLICSRNAYFP